MNKICCLTVLYNGKELPDAAAAMIAACLVDMKVITDVDQCTIVYKDSESIANAILATEKASSISIPLGNDASSQEKIVAAVAHIGKYFAEDISKCKKTRDYAPFALHLIVECDRDQTIHKSVEILATESGVISKDIARKYGFTEKIIEVIKSVYYNH
jgi:hypothetical protein